MNISSDAARTETVEILTDRLLHDGYCILPDAVPSELAARFSNDLDGTFGNTPFCEGGFYGPRTKRFGSLLTRSDAAADFVQHPIILDIARKVLGPWCECFNLNLTQGIEIHPGAPAQYSHRDQDMWDGAKGEIQYLLNVIWPLSAFTAENGATLVWPGSHRPEMLNVSPDQKPIVAEMTPGSALIFLGSTLHGAGANLTSEVRRGIFISYCLGWLKPFENQWLCYPPHVARDFSHELASLVGYSLHRPNLGNYEGQDPAILLSGDVPRYLAATDALRPEQQTALTAFLAQQAEVDAPAARHIE